MIIPNLYTYVESAIKCREHSSELRVRDKEVWVLATDDLWVNANDRLPGPGWGWFLWAKSPNSGAEMHRARVGARLHCWHPLMMIKWHIFVSWGLRDWGALPPPWLQRCTQLQFGGRVLQCCRLLQAGPGTADTRTQPGAWWLRHLETISTSDTKNCELWVSLERRNIVTPESGKSHGEKSQADWSQAQGHA